MSLQKYLEIPEIAAKYKKVRQYFHMRESTYDVTSVCQLRCDGCYYFQGDKYSVKDNRDPETWRTFFETEKTRGINYVVLAGAEPAMVPKVLEAVHSIIPFGTVASNGLKKLPESLGYRVHLSIWGDAEGDPVYRKFANGKPGPFCLPKQLENYKGDNRVVFVYTFNHRNIDEVDSVAKAIADAGHRMTFNIFSSPEDKATPLQMRDHLQKTREKMFNLMSTHREAIIYSYYGAEVHTNVESLDQQFGCPYPRARLNAAKSGIGISRTFRSYRADLTHQAENNCCVPDIDCSDCRHYAAGSVIVTSRLDQHLKSEKSFRGWLDYVDAYLAVWVHGYKPSEYLYQL